MYSVGYLFPKPNLRSVCSYSVLVIITGVHNSLNMNRKTLESTCSLLAGESGSGSKG